jgi:hypothetical protein
VWGAALHAVYLAAVPEALRVSVAQRNTRVWKVRAVYVRWLLVVVQQWVVWCWLAGVCLCLWGWHAAVRSACVCGAWQELISMASES